MYAYWPVIEFVASLTKYLFTNAINNVIKCCLCIRQTESSFFTQLMYVYSECNGNVYALSNYNLFVVSLHRWKYVDLAVSSIQPPSWYLVIVVIIIDIVSHTNAHTFWTPDDTLRTLRVPSAAFDIHPLLLDNLLYVHILPQIRSFFLNCTFTFFMMRVILHYVIMWLCVPHSTLNICFHLRSSAMVLKLAWIMLTHTHLIKKASAVEDIKSVIASCAFRQHPLNFSSEK